MTLRIRIDVNGDEITEIRVRNLGHPSDGNHSGWDDLRLYSVTTVTRTPEGDAWTEPTYVLHQRREGWNTLTRKALQALTTQQTLNPLNPVNPNPQRTP